MTSDRMVQLPSDRSQRRFERPGRLDYVHYARGMAMLGVVLIHTNDMMGWPEGSLGAVIGDMLFNITVCFLFISGFLFQHLSKKIDYRKYIWLKIKNVVAPYIFISIPAILIYLLLHKHHPWLPDSFFHQSPINIIAYFLMTGEHLGPLWFIPMMCLFYLAAPIFHWIDQRPKWYAVIAPLLVVSLFAARPEHNSNPFPAFVHLLPVYLIGMAASRWKDVVTPIAARHFGLLMLVVVAATCAAAWPGLPRGATLHLKLPLCVAMIAAPIRFPQWRPLWLAYIADLSFGIFFVHAYIVGFGRLLEGRFPALFHASPLNLIVAYGLILGLSVAVVAAIRRVSGSWSQVLIGVKPLPRATPLAAPRPA